jgi:hypothetical protein
MDNDLEYEQKVKKISKIFLEGTNRMLSEKDLLNYLDNFDLFEEILDDLNARFENIGYEIISTVFLKEKYYLLATEGKDMHLNPEQYGILAIILGLNKEIGRDLTVNEFKDLFSNVWRDIEYLLKSGYLNKNTIKNETHIVLTPLTKILFKNVIDQIGLTKILNEFEFKEQETDFISEKTPEKIQKTTGIEPSISEDADFIEIPSSNGIESLDGIQNLPEELKQNWNIIIEFYKIIISSPRDKYSVIFLNKNKPEYISNKDFKNIRKILIEMGFLKKDNNSVLLSKKGKKLKEDFF